MKRKICSCLIAFIMLTSCIFASGCGRRNAEPEQVVTLKTDSWIMDNYMQGIEEYDNVVYEQVYFDHGERSIGPTESRFRGVVYLTEDEALSLTESYEWEEVQTTEFEFEQITSDDLGEGPWYSSTEFNKDNFNAVIVNYVVFDGERIVFDISQI